MLEAVIQSTVSSELAAAAAAAASSHQSVITGSMMYVSATESLIIAAPTQYIHTTWLSSLNLLT